MKLFFSFLVVVFLAFSGYHLTFKGVRLPLFARKFYLTGTEFLFLGLFLGPGFTGIIDGQTLVQLKPLIAFLLGWAGFLFGFQFEIKKLRRSPVNLLAGALIEGVFTAAVVFFSVSLICWLCLKFDRMTAIFFGAVMGAVAAPTSQTGPALISLESSRLQKGLVGYLRFVSGIDGLVAVLLLAVLFFFRPFVSPQNFYWLDQGTNMLMLISLSSGLVVLFGIFLMGRLAEGEMALVVIAMLVISGGGAAVLNFSPLVINVILGICLANMVRNKERIFHMLVAVEKPAYLLILLFLGVTWNIASWWVLPVSALYFLIVATGKIVGGHVFRRLIKPDTLPPLFGLGLLSPGGLTLAILLDIDQIFPPSATAGMVGVALVTIIVMDMLSPYLLGWLTKNRPAPTRIS